MTAWDECRLLTCSVLPVRTACQCECPFCFTRSSISTLESERRAWTDADLLAHFRWAAQRGATRLVVTGGGEPLLRPAECVRLVRLGSQVFDELALFTNGAQLSPGTARDLRRAGLSYLCWSRHEIADDANRVLMGAAAPDADAVLAAASSAGLPVRATCVMNRAGVASTPAVDSYISAFAAAGVREFTFKHTYVAGERSVFASSTANSWSRDHCVEHDPFRGRGDIVARLPWGPVVRRIEEVQVCHYFEPTPAWERANRLARSSNLLSDGRVYASLEDRTSLLHRLPSCDPTSSASRSSTPVRLGGRSARTR